MMKNTSNFKRPPRVILIAAAVVTAAAAIALAAAFGAGSAADLAAATGGVSENALLTSLGYTEELVAGALDGGAALDGEAALAGEERIGALVEALPLQAYRKYISFSMEEAREIGEEGREISILYEFDDKYSRGGNGLDPFPETVRENNALILFAAVDGLNRVNFLHYDEYGSQAPNRVDSYDIADLTGRFGEISPQDMDFADLYGALAGNIQISEFYFAHDSRIYLGAASDEVAYRSGEPDEVVQSWDGAAVWMYKAPDEGPGYTPPAGWQAGDSGYAQIYHFSSSPAAENDDPAGLYVRATLFYESGGEYYDELTAYLGAPALMEDMGGARAYISYPLREGGQRNAYFILRGGRVAARGLMYGNDWASLEIPD